MADQSAVQIRSLVDETDIGKARPGMQASASVAGRSRRDGGDRRQPTDYRFGGEFWVVMDTPGREIRKVRTGVTDLDNVEIVSGLGEDDRVLVLPSSHLLETQQDLQRFINRRVSGVPGIS
jgi:hypothetical protein